MHPLYASGYFDSLQGSLRETCRPRPYRTSKHQHPHCSCRQRRRKAGNPATFRDTEVEDGGGHCYVKCEVPSLVVFVTIVKKRFACGGRGPRNVSSRFQDPPRNLAMGAFSRPSVRLSESGGVDGPLARGTGGMQLAETLMQNPRVIPDVVPDTVRAWKSTIAIQLVAT